MSATVRQNAISLFAVVVGVGTASAFATSVAFASSEQQSLSLSSPAEERVNANLSSDNVFKLGSAVLMTTPAQNVEQKGVLSFEKLMVRAFTNDDLKNLYGTGGFATCETSSSTPSFFEKNYSNFAGSCYAEFQSRQAISFDERFQANPTSHGVAVSPLGGRVQWSTISAGVRQRLLQRSVLDFADSNKFLSTLVRGKLNFSFGLSSFFSKSKDVKQEQPAVQFPRYHVEVLEPAGDAQGHHSRNRPLVASLGSLLAGSVQKQSHWYSEKPARKRRVLKETFDTPAVTTPTNAAGLEDDSAKDAEHQEFSQEISSLMRSVSQRAGLSVAPFSQVDVRTERRVVNDRSVLALRATESQELAFAELPDLRKPTTSTLIWGYKIPYKNHAISVRKDENIQEKITTYSYKIDDSNKSELNYNHKSKAVSAGFVISF